MSPPCCMSILLVFSTNNAKTLRYTSKTAIRSLVSNKNVKPPFVSICIRYRSPGAIYMHIESFAFICFIPISHRCICPFDALFELQTTFHEVHPFRLCSESASDETSFTCCVLIDKYQFPFRRNVCLDPVGA